jgi:hypothetical protein
MANYDIYVHIQICNSCWCQTPFSGFAPTSTECQVRAEPCQSVYCSQINQESSNKVNSVHCGQRMAHWALGVLGHGSYVGHTKPSSQEKHSPKNLGVGWGGWLENHKFFGLCFSWLEVAGGLGVPYVLGAPRCRSTLFMPSWAAVPPLPMHYLGAF